MKFSVRTAGLCLSLLASVVHAQQKVIESEFAVACWNAASTYDFGCEESTVCLCESQPFMGTALQCIRSHLVDGDAINKAYKYVAGECMEEAFISYTFTELDTMYYNSSNYLISANSSSVQNKEVLSNPVQVPTKLYEKLYLSSLFRRQQYDRSTRYGIGLIIFWFAIMGLSALNRFILRSYTEIVFKNSPFLNSLRKRFVLPATFHESHGRPLKIFRGLYVSAPTRGQSLILLCYFGLNIVFLFVSYESPIKGMSLNLTGMGWLALYSNRAGNLAFIQIPLIVLFATRNNLLISLTGWSYDTFQIYHRWVARTMVTHALIHSILYTYRTAVNHGTAGAWTSDFWRNANVATISGILMVVFALSAFRSRFYELFYLTHKALYIAFMVTLCGHLRHKAWMGWVWIAVGIHVAERVTRIWKTIYSGFSNQAYAELFDDNTFRLSVKYSKRWDMAPGQYCYVRILHKNMFWQAHPFSVYKSPDEGDNELHFAVKAKGGATRKIANYLAAQPRRSAKFSVIIEGPYGVHAPVEKYDTVLLMAGGIGVTATYSYALEAKRMAKRGQRVVFIWIIQNITPLEWFGDEILSLAGTENIELQIYITKKFTGQTFSGADESEAETVLEIGAEFQAMHNDNEKNVTLASERSVRGRPSLQKMLPAQRIQDQFGYYLFDRRPDVNEEVTKLLRESNGNVAIVSCGPPSFIDGIRLSIVHNLEQTDGRVDYFEEAFSW